MAWAMAVALNCGASAVAKEVRGRPERPGDWSAQSRMAFDQWAHNLRAGDEKAIQTYLLNSFVRASLHNAQNGAAGEYATISERTSFYSFVSIYLKGSENTQEWKKQIRFFDAATIVTYSIWGIQAIDSNLVYKAGVFTSYVLSWLGVGFPSRSVAITEEAVRQSNSDLFKVNMGVLKRLFVGNNAIFNPLNSGSLSVTNAIEFDRALVILEQTQVQRSVNSVCDDVVGRRLMNTMTRVSMKQRFLALGIRDDVSVERLEKVDFCTIEDRVWIGFALIGRLHGRAPSEAASALSEVQRSDPLILHTVK